MLHSDIHQSTWYITAPKFKSKNKNIVRDLETKWVNLTKNTDLGLFTLSTGIWHILHEKVK